MSRQGMKLLSRISPVLLFFMLTAAGGCVRVTEENDTVHYTAGVRENLMPGDVQLGDEVLKAIQKQDFDTFRKVLEGKMAYRVGEQDFLTSCENLHKQFGVLKSFRFLTPLDTPVVRNLVWVVRFEQDTESGGVKRTEMMFRLILADTDGQTQVLGMGFF